MKREMLVHAHAFDIQHNIQACVDLTCVGGNVNTEKRDELVLRLILNFMPIYFYSFKLGIHYMRETIKNHHNNHTNQHNHIHHEQKTHETRRFYVETLSRKNHQSFVLLLM